MIDLPIPQQLRDLISAGVWPSADRAASEQNLHPLASADRVRTIAAEEEVIYLYRPPFRTIADEIASASDVVVNEFWMRHGALNDIIAEKALLLGDFGLGSDAPIILNYALDAVDPPVFRLRWASNEPNKWVQAARNFDDLVALLGLMNRDS